jgi:hypothetical protein
MPGSSTTLGRPDARADASDHVAFRLRNSVGAQDANLYEAQRLAYALPYRRFAVALADDRARLAVDADRYSFIVSDLHRLLLAGLSGALRKIPYVIVSTSGAAPMPFLMTGGLPNRRLLVLLVSLIRLVRHGGIRYGQFLELAFIASILDNRPSIVRRARFARRLLGFQI